MRDLPDYDSPTALKQFLDSRGMAMQKKFGQNFLINGGARSRLVSALSLEPNMSCWEVGPGLGAMTADLLRSGARLTAFEIDRGFSDALEIFFSDEPRFKLVRGDVLKTWEKERDQTGLPSRFFGNLPYNVAATMMADFISAGSVFERAVITVQKEVALRMTAKVNTSDYSSFTVLCRWAYDVSALQDLSPSSFWPRPNVDSRAVLMTRKASWSYEGNTGIFLAAVRALFSSRRKTVLNNYKQWIGSPAFEKALSSAGVARSARHEDGETILRGAGIQPTARAETLDVDAFLALSDIIGSI